MKWRKIVAWMLIMLQVIMLLPVTSLAATYSKTVSAKLTMNAPIIDGELDDSIWSLDNPVSLSMLGNSSYSAIYDVKWDAKNVYFAVEVIGDTELIDGDSWMNGDVVSIMLDPTCHQNSPYVKGDWQIGIGYNSVDNNKPYILMGSAVQNDTTKLYQDISAVTKATSKGWNAEFSLSWESLGIDPNTEKEMGFDLAVDNKLSTHGTNECDTVVWWAENNATSFWNDTSGFGKLVLSNDVVSAQNEPILNVDFTDGTEKDSSTGAHQAVKYGSPAISSNDHLGKNMASFNGVDDAYAYPMTTDDYAKIQNGYTMESMMKLNGTQGAPCMNLENGGLGYQLNQDGKTLEFTTTVSGSAITVSSDISSLKNQWIHTVSTYDGTNVNLYINGELKDSKPASGELTIPADSAKWFVLGADTNASGNIENPMDCNLSFVRIFSGTMDQSMIAKLYAKANDIHIIVNSSEELTSAVNETVTIPTANAYDANNNYDVTITVKDPNKNEVSVSNGTFIPEIAGVYLITYQAFNKTVVKKVTVSPKSDWKQLGRDGVKVRLAVGSDIHIGSNAAASTKFRNALSVFKTIDPNLDALAFVGDITDSGLPTQYNTLMRIAKESGLSDKIKWCMGNHEFYGWSSTTDAINQFKASTGSSPNEVVKIGGSNGITLIKLGASDANADYSGQYEFLKNALETAAKENPTAPIFVLAHHGVPNTAYVTDEWYGTYGDDMIKLMAKYPQIIHISGHSHSTVDDPRSIDQSAGFTCIQDSTVAAYFENESGMINSEGSHSTYPEYSSEASQALMIDVDNNNVVTIRRMDLTSAKYINGDDPWVINTPDLVANKNFTYTKELAKTSKPPVFASGSTVKATKTSANSVNFSFSQASAADALDSIVLGDSDSNMVHSYKMIIENTKTGEKVSDKKFQRDYYLRFSDYYRSTQSPTLSAKINGLEPKTEYKIEVFALTPYNVESSNSISTTFTTEAASNKPSEKILDVDFADGTAKDNSEVAHNTVVKGAPVLSNNEALGKYMASFDGEDDAYAYYLSSEDYDKFKESFTMGCMFQLNQYKNSDIFMNCEGAGLGYELNGDGHTLEFWAHINGEYKVVSTDISTIKNKWIHAVTTYDGTEMKLYINGTLKDSKNTSGTLDIPNDLAKWLMIGSDTGNEGNVQSPANCNVSNALLLSGAISGQDVLALYQKDNPIRITVKDEIKSNGTVGDQIVIPVGTARDANNNYDVTIDVLDPDGKAVNIENGKIVLSKAGTYKVQYNAGSSKKTYSIIVASSEPSTPTPTPTTQPTVAPTTVPTATPTTKPTTAPTTVPTAIPTIATPIPTVKPTIVPTPIPTTKPTTVPTPKSTTVPSTKPTDTPTTAKKSREVTMNFKCDDSKNTSAKITITRTILSDGTKKDTLHLDEHAITKTIKALVKQKNTHLIINISDTKNDYADEVEVQLTKDIASILVKNNATLQVQTKKGNIEISKKSLINSKGKNIRITISDIKDKKIIKDMMNSLSKKSKGTTMIGLPIHIKMNQNYNMKVTIPIDTKVLPTNKDKMKEFISSLVVMIQGDDHKIHLQKGTIIYNEHGVPIGITISIDQSCSLASIKK
ncbi:LamG-like jellyroll fold domain-containing protein [Anaeromicropila herbilytica]|uniref:Uncharacterized protein n=1 Tax=Anaeromicropila herbilytica TaxID=2785025 RepID=A0A7R7EL09_9FIRM|nr:LamG-like jellyroll fold domain-containing protein [Anaeromicropila herbilytica]BCN30780.1 hypothetical protein bsdtb5_20750 [Anaeromicropila herbilytica]